MRYRLKKRRMKKLIKKLLDWEGVLIGFSGRGKTVFDRELRGARITWREMEILKPVIEQERKRRWEAYRQACIEVIGEDPEMDF